MRKCGCRSRFCSGCCLALGLRLKDRLRSALAKFKGLMMLTFTIDPQLFPGGPEEAFEYVRSNRCLSVTMQRLDRWGFLHSRRYAYVVEWQRNTEQAHYHVLVDASYIPVAKLREAWNRNWPAWEERVAIGRPGFGSAKFSAPKFETVDKAIGYVTAYVTKVPEQGFPEWVLERMYRSVHRFSTSRGFWSDGGEEEAPEDVSTHQDENRNTVSEEEQEGEDEQQEKRTIRQVLERCGKSCVVLRVHEGINQETGEVVEKREFLAEFPVELIEVVFLLGGALNRAATAVTYQDEGEVLRALRAYALTKAPSAGG